MAFRGVLRGILHPAVFSSIFIFVIPKNRDNLHLLEATIDNEFRKGSKF